MAERKYLKYGLLLLILVALFLAARLLPLDRWIDAFTGWVGELGVFGMVVFALAYAVATVMMLPGSVLTLAGGAVFGLLPGFITVSIGSILGAALAFLVSRFVARERVEKWIQEKPSFAAIDRAVARQGWKIVALTRLSPVFPFNFQNYAYGLTKVAFWHYVLASWVGMIPGTFLYVYLGTIGRTSLEAAADASEAQTFNLVLQIVGLLATVAVTVIITRIARRALREAGLDAQDRGSRGEAAVTDSTS